MKNALGQIVDAGGKGQPRGDVVLAGAMDIAIGPDSEGLPCVMVHDPVEMQLRPFERGDELIAEYQTLDMDRECDERDLCFTEMLLEPGEHFTLTSQVAAETAGLRGDPIPVERNAPCPCGSGRKFKVCCLRIWEDGARHADATDCWPVRVVDRWIDERLAASG